MSVVDSAVRPHHGAPDTGRCHRHWHTPSRRPPAAPSRPRGRALHAFAGIARLGLTVPCRRHLRSVPVPRPPSPHSSVPPGAAVAGRWTRTGHPCRSERDSRRRLRRRRSAPGRRSSSPRRQPRSKTCRAPARRCRHPATAVVAESRVFARRRRAVAVAARSSRSLVSAPADVDRERLSPASRQRTAHEVTCALRQARATA